MTRRAPTRPFDPDLAPLYRPPQGVCLVPDIPDIVQGARSLLDEHSLPAIAAIITAVFDHVLLVSRGRWDADTVGTETIRLLTKALDEDPGLRQWSTVTVIPKVGNSDLFAALALWSGLQAQDVTSSTGHTDQNPGWPEGKAPSRRFARDIMELTLRYVLHHALTAAQALRLAHQCRQVERLPGQPLLQPSRILQPDFLCLMADDATRAALASQAMKGGAAKHRHVPLMKAHIFAWFDRHYCQSQLLQKTIAGELQLRYQILTVRTIGDWLTLHRKAGTSPAQAAVRDVVMLYVDQELAAGRMAFVNEIEAHDYAADLAARLSDLVPAHLKPQFDQATPDERGKAAVLHGILRAYPYDLDPPPPEFWAPE